MKDLPELKTNVRQISDLTVCPFDGRPERECVDRQCISCGTESVRRMYQPLLIDLNGDDTDVKVGYHQWENAPEKYTNKEGKVIHSKRWKQIQKSARPEDLIDELSDDMKSFTSHQFRADFQNTMERNLMDNLPNDQCAVVMDFSQNIALQAQDEIESANWTTKQVTLHPIHIVRHSTNSRIQEPEIINESLILLSDSLAHDANTVFAFTNQLVRHLQDNPGPCKINVIHRFSDNCAQQYKCKDAFSHIGLLEKEHGIKLIYHFTESGHGKGPSDGLGAAIKRRLEQMILGGKVINDAYQAYLALVQSPPETKSGSQRILYMPAKAMSRAKPPKQTDIKTVPGTQSYHMVKTLPQDPSKLECSDLSCTCSVCIVAAMEGPCFYIKFLKGPRVHQLLPRGYSSSRNRASILYTIYSLIFCSCTKNINTLATINPLLHKGYLTSVADDFWKLAFSPFDCNVFNSFVNMILSVLQTIKNIIK